MKKRILFFFFLGCSAFSYGQWTLEQCIDTALTHNVSLLAKQFQVEKAEIYKNGSRYNILPSVGLTATHGYNWGQTIDLFTNQFATNRVQFDNFYLSSSVTLFSGLQNYYGIRVADNRSEQAGLEKAIAERNIRIDVTTTYLQLLLNKEVLKNAERKYQDNILWLNRFRELRSAGQAVDAELIEAEALLEESNYLKIKAKSDVSYSQLLLKQLLNIQTDQPIDIAEMSLDSLTITLAAPDVNEQPEMLLLSLREQEYLYLLKSAKGRFYPTLLMSGSLGSGFSGNSKYQLPDGSYDVIPFEDQIGSNFYRSILFSLNVPIFSRMANVQQCRLRKLELESLQVEKQSSYIRLQQQLEQLKLEISTTMAQLEAVEKSEKAASVNYDNSVLLYENKNITFSHLQFQNHKLQTAVSDHLQATYRLYQKLLILSYFVQ